MRYPEALAAEMFSKIAEWQQSGLSQKAYCQQHTIPYHVFHYWYKRYRDAQPSIAAQSSFIPLQIASPVIATTACMELVFTDGKRLLFHQPLSIDDLKTLLS